MTESHAVVLPAWPAGLLTIDRAGTVLRCRDAPGDPAGAVGRSFFGDSAAEPGAPWAGGRFAVFAAGCESAIDCFAATVERPAGPASVAVTMIRKRDSADINVLIRSPLPTAAAQRRADDPWKENPDER